MNDHLSTDDQTNHTHINQVENAPMKFCDEIIINCLYFILYFSTIANRFFTEDNIV